MENSQKDTQDHLLSLLENIKKHLPTWQYIQSSDISFTRLTGFTNITYKVKVLDENSKIIPNILVYREFCKNESFFSRKEESYIFSSLGDQDLGPKSYGGDENYRLEEFIFGKHPDVTLMCSRPFNLCAAKYISKFHTENLQELDTNPSALKYLNKLKPYEEFFKMTEFYKDKVTEKELEMIKTLQNFVCDKELDFLKEKLKEINGKVTFCHNDLNANNIFLRDSGLDLKNALIFIDFEYCSYNFRGYDIGDFMMEHTFDYNYEPYPYFKFTLENFPNNDQLYEFSIFYTFFTLTDKFKIVLELDVLDYKVEDLVNLLQKHDNTITIKDFLKDAEQIFQEIKIGTMVSCFYWVLWSGSICKNPSINFDYLLHGINRIEAYKLFKKRYFNS